MMLNPESKPKPCWMLYVVWMNTQRVRERSRCWHLSLYSSGRCFKTEETPKTWFKAQKEVFQRNVKRGPTSPSIICSNGHITSSLYYHWKKTLGNIFDHLFHPVISPLCNFFSFFLLRGLSESQSEGPAEQRNHTPLLGDPQGLTRRSVKALVCLLWTGGGFSSSVVKKKKNLPSRPPWVWGRSRSLPGGCGRSYPAGCCRALCPWKKKIQNK